MMNSYLKKILTLALLTSISGTATSEIVEQDNKLIGPYLGQTPPGAIPEVFAPGIVSTEQRDLSGFFSPDMSEFYFTRKELDVNKWSLFVYKNKNNQWHGSKVGNRVGRPIFSPDGSVMHLGKNYRERTDKGWSEIKSLGPMFDRPDWGIMRLSSSAKGTYVLDDARSDDVIRISTIENGKRQAPTLLGKEINSGKWTAHPFIAPDESYLIWDSEREEGFGDSDLYISFKQSDGTWGKAINMGDKVNTQYWESSGYITPDGKYFFFNRMSETGNGDIYWVEAQFIEALRP